MEKSVNSLNIQQACESAPKIMENIEYNGYYYNRPESVSVTKPVKDSESLSEERKAAAGRFGSLSVGCLLYALIYTFCMYHNKEGITYPFFVGVTLYFFFYYTKKYCGIMKKSNGFLVGSIVILGIVTATTASPVIILLNKWMILFLLSVLVLRTYYDVTGWDIPKYFRAVSYMAGGTICHMFSPFSDIFDYIKIRNIEKGKCILSDKTKRVVFAVSAGIVLSVPMLFVIGVLLGEADVYFAYYFYESLDLIFENEYEWFEIISNLRGVAVSVVFMFMAVYGLLAYIGRKNGIEEMARKDNKRWDCIIAITFTFLIGSMYLFFVWIQIIGLFMGKLSLPYGYSYAEYAREGFFQLAFVCVFNVILVLVCVNCFEKHKILQILLTVISLCTYVMLVSSAYRMFLYIGEEQQLTFLRVFVLWGIVVIALVMAAVIISIYKESFPLFSYMLTTVTVLYIIFALIHPDYFIAKYNVSQAEKGVDVDEWYLTEELSLDGAAPILEMYTKWLQSEGTQFSTGYVEDYLQRIDDETLFMNLRDYNFSKGIARNSADDFVKILNGRYW